MASVNQCYLFGVSIYPHPHFLAASFCSGAVLRHGVQRDCAGNTAGFTYNSTSHINDATDQTQWFFSFLAVHEAALLTLSCKGALPVSQSKNSQAPLPRLVIPATRCCVLHQRKPPARCEMNTLTSIRRGTSAEHRSCMMTALTSTTIATIF